jgi:hypothetical protein
MVCANAQCVGDTQMTLRVETLKREGYYSCDQQYRGTAREPLASALLSVRHVCTWRTYATSYADAFCLTDAVLLTFLVMYYGVSLYCSTPSELLIHVAQPYTRMCCCSAQNRRVLYALRRLA